MSVLAEFESFEKKIVLVHFLRVLGRFGRSSFQAEIFLSLGSKLARAENKIRKSQVRDVGQNKSSLLMMSFWK
jgi:hypothetical protein